MDENILVTEMEDHFYSSVPILKIVRVIRREGDDRIPTMRVKIIFKGLIPLRFVTVYGKADLKVYDHIPFTQCYRRYRFNHVSNHCKQRLESCKQCFQIHDDAATCSLTIKCSNCKEDHILSDRDCKARAKAYNIKRVMALENP